MNSLLHDMGVVVNECTTIVIPHQYILGKKTQTMIHPKKGPYQCTLYLIPRHLFHRILKQHTQPYKTHQYSCIGPPNTRKPKTPIHTKTHTMIPFQHLTHIQQNSKGILVGVVSN